MLEAKGLDHFMDVCAAIHDSQPSDAQLGGIHNTGSALSCWWCQNGKAPSTGRNDGANAAVFTRLPTQRASEIEQLLPHQWVAAETT
ncbi:hypothetical protein [Pseudomonas sp. S2_H01]